jgi:hypothetical protein
MEDGTFFLVYCFGRKLLHGNLFGKDEDIMVRGKERILMFPIIIIFTQIQLILFFGCYFWYQIFNNGNLVDIIFFWGNVGKTL